MDFGDRLKSGRESKALTLQQVARELKINLNILKKVENSDAGGLPNATSTTGFIRSYAQHICIDSAPLIENYLEKLESESVNKSAQNSVLNEANEPAPFFLSVFIQKKVLPVVVLASILGLGYFSYNYLDEIEELFSKTNLTQNNSDESTLDEKIDSETKISEAQNIRVKDIEKDSNLSKDEELKDSTQSDKKETAVTTIEADTDAKTKNTEKEAVKNTKVSSDTASSEAKTIAADTTASAKKANDDIKKEEDGVEAKLIIEPLSESYAYYRDQNSDKILTLKLKPTVKRVLKFTTAEITFADAGAVSLILNGKDIGSPGIFAERKTIKFPSLEGL